MRNVILLVSQKDKFHKQGPQDKRSLSMETSKKVSFCFRQTVLFLRCTGASVLDELPYYGCTTNPRQKRYGLLGSFLLSKNHLKSAASTATTPGGLRV